MVSAGMVSYIPGYPCGPVSYSFNKDMGHIVTLVSKGSHLQWSHNVTMELRNSCCLFFLYFLYV